MTESLRRSEPDRVPRAALPWTLAMATLSVFVAALAAVAILVYRSQTMRPCCNAEYWIARDAAWIGHNVFLVVGLLEAALVAAIAPAVTLWRADGSPGRTTLAAAGWLLLLIVAALPVTVLALLLGGVGLRDVATTQASLLAAGLLASQIALLCASLWRRRAAATAAAYGVQAYLFVQPILLLALIWSMTRSGPTPVPVLAAMQLWPFAAVLMHSKATATPAGLLTWWVQVTTVQTALAAALFVLTVRLRDPGVRWTRWALVLLGLVLVRWMVAVAATPVGPFG